MFIIFCPYIIYGRKLVHSKSIFTSNLPVARQQKLHAFRNVDSASTLLRCAKCFLSSICFKFAVECNYYSSFSQKVVFLVRIEVLEINRKTFSVKFHGSKFRTFSDILWFVLIFFIACFLNRNAANIPEFAGCLVEYSSRGTLHVKNSSCWMSEKTALIIIYCRFIKWKENHALAACECG